MKTALITGASSGIGKELAFVFARKGYNLVLVARRMEVLTQIAKACKTKHGVASTIISQDLSKRTAAQDLYADIQERGIVVDVLINNAGFGIYGPFSEQDAEQAINMVNLNITTLTALTSLFVKEMIKRDSGKILNVASTAAFQPVPKFAAYAGSKAYVLHFTEALHYELKETNVSASALCPGPTATGFEEKADMKDSNLFKGGVMKASTVAEIGYQGLMKNKMTIIPGFKNKIMATLSGMTPSRKLLVWVAGKIS